MVLKGRSHWKHIAVEGAEAHQRPVGYNYSSSGGRGEERKKRWNRRKRRSPFHFLKVLAKEASTLLMISFQAISMVSLFIEIKVLSQYISKVF